ncbi:TPA: helix-turn-helix domain-containing protein [Pseudomonas aeruginosa]
MVKNRRLFTAGKRLRALRALRELMGLSRPQFAELVGMTAKRLENIENELQRMHDEDFEKVCGTFPEFSDWIAYEGSIEPQSIAWKVADSAQAAAVYLVERNPVLLERHGIDMQAWRERHREIREALLAAEQAPEAEPAPLEEPPEPRRQRKRKTPASGKGD